MSMRMTLLSGCLAIFALTTTSIKAANCALRNPDRQIYEIFPDATNYRSVVVEVNTNLRSAIEKRLTEKLAFGDLGKHTVYVVFRNAVPLGFVHARTEVGSYGSVELIWAMDLDLKIKHFRVQRSREKHTDAIRSDNFQQQLIGRSAEQLQSLKSNSVLDSTDLQISTEAWPIAQIALLSGAKTLIITELAFHDAIHRARLLGYIHQAFPNTTKVTKIKKPFKSKAITLLEQLTNSSTTLIDRDHFTALRSLDQNGTTLGALAFSQSLSHSSGAEYWWTVTAEGRILKVWITGTADETKQTDLTKLIGKNLDGVTQLFEKSDDSSSRHALEVLAVFATAGIGS